LIVPLFILLTVIGFLFSIIFITGSISTADFCYNSPDGPVLSILEVLRSNFRSFVIFFLEFYIFEVSRYLDNYVTATTWFCSPTIDNGYFEITGCPIGEALLITSIQS
jgi:hypothetical protein